MMTLRQVSALAGVAFPLLLATPSWAQPPAAAPAAAPAKATDEADAIFYKGKAAFDAGKLDQAYELYQRAWALRQTHDIAGNLAQVELSLGKTRDAAEHLAFALAHYPPSIHDDKREKLNKVLDGLRAQLGVLRITVSLPDAKVAIDDKPIGASPLGGDVFVDPGPHVVEATLSGYKPAQAHVDASKGSSQDVALSLVVLPEPPGGGRTEAAGVRKPLIITGAVVGGAGIVLGAVFAGLSNARASDVAAKHNAIVNTGATAACGPMLSPDCEALQSAKQDQVRFANASAWSFIAGGAVGAGTVIYALAAPRAGKKAGTRVVPTLAAGGGGVVVHGEW